MKRSLKQILSTVVIAFGIIAFWRGVWGLMDYYLFPGHHIMSLWISLIIGVAILYSTESLIKRLI
jgi:uncharacterized membrane protein